MSMLDAGMMMVTCVSISVCVALGMMVVSWVCEL